MERQSFDDASFDCVISLDVMEHVCDPAAAYREIFRTLRTGGLCIHTFGLMGIYGEVMVCRWPATAAA